MTNQTSLFKSITTKDGRFTFHWPLPVHLHAEIREVGGVRRYLSAIQAEMNQLLQDGYRVRCPITGTVLTLYRRMLTTTHLAILCSLYGRSLTHTGFHHYRSFSRGHSDGDLAKMLHWGLVEMSTDEGGMWRITALARRWLHGADRIPRHQAIFRSEHLGPWNDEDLIGPAQVDERFDKNALFGSPAA